VFPQSQDFAWMRQGRMTINQRSPAKKNSPFKFRLPLQPGYEIFAGNTTDVTTVQPIVEKMEERFGKANRVWVMDRGMVSAENISWL
jgi:hypothetical protein